jgi:beta-lactam-binding protein with PASTA domain
VKCVVPHVVGLTLARARTRIVNHHCRVGAIARKRSSLQKRGKVLVQAPKPGKRLKSGAKVNLVIGKGPRRT